MKCVIQKILSLLLVVTMVFCCGTALPITVMAGAGAMEDVCEIVGGKKYASVKMAVDEATDGQTVRMLGDYTETEPIEVAGKTIYFDLGDFDLNIDTSDRINVPTALLIREEGSLVQKDSGVGRLSISSGRTGIYLFEAKEVVILNGDVTGVDFGLLALYGGTFSLNGNIHGKGASVYGGGDAVIAIKGDINSEGTGIITNNRAVITVSGGVTGGKIGLEASLGARVTVNGDVTGGVFGVRASDSSIVNVTGNILADGNLHDSFGKIIAVGVEASDGGTVYVNGQISTIVDKNKDLNLPWSFTFTLYNIGIDIDAYIDNLFNEAECSYIWFNIEPFDPKRVAETPYPPVTLIDGIRYYAYSHDDEGTVYVKVAPDENEHGANIFSDVPEDAWHYDAVSYVFEQGLMIGTATNIFSPNATLTRAMMVTILYRQADTPDVSGIIFDFTDVVAGEWYTDAVKWAVSNNIVLGYGNGKFGTNDAVTKEQLAALIYRAQQADGNIPPDILMDYEWSDWNDISIWARGAVNVLTIQGVFRDIKGTNFNPKNAASRAEVASVLYRYLTAIEQ